MEKKVKREEYQKLRQEARLLHREYRLEKTYAEGINRLSYINGARDTFLSCKGKLPTFPPYIGPTQEGWKQERRLLQSLLLRRKQALSFIEENPHKESLMKGLVLRPTERKIATILQRSST